MAVHSSLMKAEAIFELNRWYALKIVGVGNAISVYVDDAPILGYVDEDDPLYSGRIGLEGGQDFHILFDDIRVSTTHRLYVAHLMKEAQDAISAAKRIEAELYKLKNQVLDEFKEGLIDEENYNILDKRIDDYMREIRDEIMRERLGGLPGELREEIQRVMGEGRITEEGFRAMADLVDRATGLTEDEKAELRGLLEKWRREYLKE